MPEIVKIEKLGSRGDGIVLEHDGPLYVAGALPGESVVVERNGNRGHLVAVEAPSPDRVAPFCPYYEACGGCLTQHMSEPLYQQWKRGIVVDALRHAGLQADVAALKDGHGDGRRRITLHVRNRSGHVEAGFMAPRSHTLVAIDHCPVTVPALHRGPDIAARIGKVLGQQAKPVSVQITATQTGLDADIRGHGPAREALRQRLIRLADELDLARIALHGEVLVERRAPSITMGRAIVTPPAGSFLQATAQGEAILAAQILAFSTGAKRIADLFCGCGPFALRLAEQAEVHAVETDPYAVQALDRAARAATGLRRVTTEVRDLFRRPLLKPELQGFDVVVVDPPRAGAEAQAKHLAESPVERIVSVSCDPGTFARDAAILVSGGYRLEQVIPVDQFRHSVHVETVALFSKDKQSRKR